MKKRFKKNENILRELQDNMKCNNTHIRILGGEKEQGTENLFEKIMTENFLILVRKKVTQVQEAQRIPIKMSPKKPTP